MSVELYAILAWAVGLPLVISGWIWGIVLARKAGSTRWILANLLYLPFIAFALIYWRASKVPFWMNTIGILLLVSTLLLSPAA